MSQVESLVHLLPSKCLAASLIIVQSLKECPLLIISNVIVMLADLNVCSFDAKAMEPYVDFFGFMAYDLHGFWDADIETLGSIVRAQV